MLAVIILPSPSVRIAFDLQITGPNNEKEFSQNDAASGKYAFTASEAGAHKVCFHNSGVVRFKFKKLDARIVI